VIFLPSPSVDDEERPGCHLLELSKRKVKNGPPDAVRMIGEHPLSDGRAEIEDSAVLTVTGRTWICRCLASSITRPPPSPEIPYGQSNIFPCFDGGKSRMRPTAPTRAETTRSASGWVATWMRPSTRGRCRSGKKPVPFEGFPTIPY